MNRPVAGTVEHRIMRRRQVVCIVALLVLFALLLSVVGYFCLFCSVPLEISKETTYLTEPLTPDGKKVDYLAAWEKEMYPDSMATDENGYRLIVRHLGVAKDALPAQGPVICRKLGLAESNLSEMPLEEPYEFLAAYVASDAFDPAVIEALQKSSAEEEQFGGMGEGESELAFVLEERLARPWTLDDLPMMEPWLAENGPAIELVAEAVRKPTFQIPLTPPVSGPLIGVFPSEFVRFRSFARCLTARARYRIGTGDIDGAIDDLVSCKRLGRHLECSGLIGPTLVGIAIEGMADAIGIAGSRAHLPTDGQFKRLVSELNDLPPRVSISEMMRFQRYVTLDLLSYMAENPVLLTDLELPVSVPRRIGLDWNVIARRFNEHFDTFLAGGSPPSPSLNAMAIISLRARSEMVADAFSAYMLPAPSLFEAVQRRTCVDRMHRITLAMLRYECEHGTLPPAYTADASGKPLHSWRVTLLPYLGQQELYDKIRIEEPWDSEFNRQFHEHAVPFYQCPSAELGPGKTTYSVVVGPEVPFEGSEGKRLADFGHKSTQMILLVEQAEPGCWMNPRYDVPQAVADAGISDAGGGRPAIGSPHPGGLNIGYRNGSVVFASETVDFEFFQKLLRGTADYVP